MSGTPATRAAGSLSGTPATRAADREKSRAAVASADDGSEASWSLTAALTAALAITCKQAGGVGPSLLRGQ